MFHKKPQKNHKITNTKITKAKHLLSTCKHLVQYPKNCEEHFAHLNIQTTKKFLQSYKMNEIMATMS